MIDFTRLRFLSFDCYGTMIDWETGIFSALRPILMAHDKTISDAELLELYADLEVRAETGEYKAYRDILQEVVIGFGSRLRFVPTKAEIESLPESVSHWAPFPDTVDSLSRIKTKFRLAVISNVDDDLFAHSAEKLQVAFDQVITAQQARCYKPCAEIFKLALKRTGARPENILHVGQSIYHDVIPAQSLGIATVWVNRRSPRPNAGAAKLAQGNPDLEVSDLRSLADRVLGAA